MVLAKVATRAAVRLAGSWRDDLRDVRWTPSFARLSTHGAQEDVRGLTGVGSLLFEHKLNELNEFYDRHESR